MKKGLRGFTLIELLVVIAIIGLLSTVIAAPITQARKKGRDGKKVADMREINSALQQFADDNAGTYPDDLTGLVPRYLSTLPTNAAAAALAKDKYMYVPYIDSLGRNVGYHLGVKLEATNLALGDDRDCTGAGTISANAKWCIDTSVSQGGTVTAGVGNVGSTGFANGDLPTGTSALTNDFLGGMDTATTNCGAAISGSAAVCVYDLTN